MLRSGLGCLLSPMLVPSLWIEKFFPSAVLSLTRWRVRGACLLLRMQDGVDVTVTCTGHGGAVAATGGGDDGRECPQGPR